MQQLNKPVCLCGQLYGTKTALRYHATQSGHFFRCKCDKLFGSLEALRGHQKKSAAQTCKLGAEEQLIIDNPHANAPNRHYCGICRNTHFPKTKLRDEHLMARHNACPTCLEVFSDPEDLRTHKEEDAHCFCSDHGLPFSRIVDLAQHVCTAHVDSYECAVCKKVFSDRPSFDHHFDTRAHCAIHKTAREEQADANAIFQLERVEKANLLCIGCNQRFVNVTAYNQHKSSPKHRAHLITLKCACGKAYKPVSAFLQHLESGNCAMGLNRDWLNTIIYRADKNRSITKPEYADLFAGSIATGSSTTSIAPDDSASVLGAALESVSIDSSRSSDRIFTPDSSDMSTQSGVILTPDGSEVVDSDSDFIPTPPGTDTDSTLSDGGVVLTPPESTVSSKDSSSAGGSASHGNGLYTPHGSSISDGSGDWSFMNSRQNFTPATSSIDGSSVDTIRFDTANKSWPCPKLNCSRSFVTKKDLTQHLESAFHAPNFFHCPTNLAGASLVHKKTQEFKTASGLVQHVEDEACVEGALDGVLGVFVAPLMEKKLEASTKLRKK